jgi:hypothetical protein
VVTNHKDGVLHKRPQEKVADNFQDLSIGMTAAAALVDRDMLTRVWDEMEYGIDVCRITQGEYTEHL